MTIRRIVHATDFSPSSEPALAAAASFAQALGAELRLLHAVVLHDDDPYNLAFHMADVSALIEQLEASAAEQLAQLARGLEERGVTVTTEARRGPHASSVILDFTEEVDADLLVLGTHGRRGPGRWLLGSVAEEVARRAPCAVLTVAQKVDREAAGSIRRILAPTDLSEPSRESLRVARELAARLGARLDVLHLVEPVIVPGPYGILPAGQPVTVDYDVLARRARAQLEEQMREGPEVPYEVHAYVGSARIDIVDFAHRVGADLIVQGSRGLTGLPRLLLGSTAEHILRTADCPVLTVKIPEQVAGPEEG